MSGEGIRISDEITLPDWEVQESFVRASGPGGQNVNKVASAVQLRWNVEASSLPRAVKDRFLRKHARRITSEGDFLIEASEHRYQSLNREAARERLASFIRDVLTPPKKRIRTRPTKGSVRRRIKAKKERGEVKALRGRIDPGAE